MAIDAAQLRVVVTADTSGAQQDLKAFSSTMKNVAGAGMAAVGGFLTAKIAEPIIGIGVSAIKTAASFEKSMNVLEYVTGAPTETMAKMQEQALQLGADTVFSAGEAAEGMVELAKAGMESEDVMASIPGVMNLAAAGGIAVNEAAGLAASTLNTFGLEASKSGEVADILAAASNASALEVKDLAYGVQNAGSVFAANGQSVESLATMMALMANNGIDAGTAATALKTMTLRLTAPTNVAAKAMEKLGLEVFDAEGNMRDYHDILEDMEIATKDMSDAQRGAAFQVIFGQEAVNAANVMVQEGIAGYEEMTAKVLEQGAAAEMADAQNKGLEGALSALSGSIETLQIKLALPFLETLAGWMGKLSELVNKMGEIPAPLTGAILIFLGIAGAAGLALVAIGGVVAALGAIEGTALAAAILPISAAVLGLALAAAAAYLIWTSNWGGIQEKTQEAADAITPLLTTMATEMTAFATETGALLAVNPQWQGFITNVENAARTLREFYQDAGKAVKDFKVPSMEELKGREETLTAELELRLKPIIEGIQLDWSTLTWSTNIIVDQVGHELSEIKWDGLTVDFAGMLTTIGTRIQEAADTALGADNIVSRTIARIGKTLTTVQTEFADLDFTDPIDAVKSVFTAAHSIITLFGGVKTDVIGTTVKTLETVITSILDFGTALTDSLDAEVLAEAAKGMVTGITNEIVKITDGDTLGNLGKAAGSFVSSLVGKLGELLGAEKFGTDVGKAIGDATVAIAAGALSFAEKFANELANTDWAQFSGQIVTFVGNFVAALIGSIGPALIARIISQSMWNPEGPQQRQQRSVMAEEAQIPFVSGFPRKPLVIPYPDTTPFDLPPPAWLERLENWKPDPLGPDWVNRLLNWIPDVPPWLADLFKGGFGGTGGGGGAGLGQEMMLGPSDFERGAIAEMLGRNQAAGFAEAIDLAPEGTEMGAAFKTAVASVGSEIGNAAGTAIKSHAALTKGPDPILSQQKNLMEGAEFTLPTLDWATFVVPLNWAEHVMILVWDSYVMRLAWESFVTILEWGSHIPDLSWGNYISTVDWGRYIPTAPIPQAPGANASGTPYWRGGATWVGEEGPELVTLPRGSRIYSNEESTGMGGTTINVFVDSINSALDIEVLAAQLAKRFQQKMRS